MAHGDDGSVLPLRFDATLGGIEAVPGPVDTLMSGRTDFLFNPEETAAQFSLTLANGANITEARLHCGPRGAAGPAVVSLVRFIEGGLNGSVGLKATLTGAGIVQGVDCFSTIGRNIVTLADLAAAMRDGNIFVDVASAAFPSGEIRGQVQITPIASTVLPPPGTFGSSARVPLDFGGESGTFIRIVTQSPETVISLPTTFNPPLRESPSSSFNPPFREISPLPPAGFNPPFTGSTPSPVFNPP